MTESVSADRRCLAEAEICQLNRERITAGQMQKCILQAVIFADNKAEKRVILEY